jgi:Ser/Thr protein kinase RdoA (MazF antagonist)
MTAADDAAREFGLGVVRLITARENEVYLAVGPNGRAALRLHRPGYQTRTAIESELWWCDALTCRGMAVPKPLMSQSGTALVQLTSSQYASAVRWIDGQPLGKAGVPLSGSPRDQALQHQILGALLKDIHGAMEGVTLPPEFQRPRWDVDGLTGDAPVWGRFWEHPDLGVDESLVLQKARDFLAERIADHSRTQGVILVHADVLRENILAGEQGLALIDFDDGGFGFPLYDLGTVLSQNLDEPGLGAIAEGLISGYAGGRSVDLGMVSVFTLMRCCASVGWTVSRLESGNPVRRRYIDRAVHLAQSLLEGRQAW